MQNLDLTKKKNQFALPYPPLKQRKSVYPLLLSLFSDGPQEDGHAGDGNNAANCEPPKQVKKLQGTVVSLLLGSVLLLSLFMVQLRAVLIGKLGHIL